MSDHGKEIAEMERRQDKADGIHIMFDVVAPDMDQGVVIKDETHGDELDNIKYFVKISMDSQSDSCTCQSFYHGNNERWLAEHGFNFQCKHIIKFKKMRGWE